MEHGEEFFVTHSPFYNFYERRSVAQFVEDELSWPSWLRPFLPGPVLQVTKDDDVFKVSCLYPRSVEVWLDMKKGGALRKKITKSKESTEEISIDGFQEVNGIWFPSKGTRTLKAAPREIRLEFTASNFSIIDNDEELYEVKLDPSSQVEDQRRTPH